ncbi:MAG: ThiF family adenylyltransferase, partial [Odoribacter sp.]|nr:ThiF family adenylyltransferase [Odoribacter sp.]
MSQQLISLNPDLQKLQSEGVDLEIRDGQIYVHHVPFLNSKQEVCGGTLAFTYSAQGDIIAPPSDHTAHWIGSKPFTEGGDEVPSLINKQVNGWNGNDEAYFLSLYRDGQSGKPYSNFYAKVKFYYDTIAGHAFQKDRAEAERIRKMTTSTTEEDVFNYQDTNSARAGIIGLTSKMKGKKVAIVGLGGTGSYLLYIFAKITVAEINLFDDDKFSTHNDYRAPGAEKI